MKSLQALFVAAKGQPIKAFGETIIQMDRLPKQGGKMRFVFIAKDQNISQGIALKATQGKIQLSNGHESKLAYIWAVQGSESVIECSLINAGGELRLWNIYKVPGSVSEADYWTNNAGMVVKCTTPTCRQYHCSDGIGAFEPNDFVFQVEL